MKWSELPKEYRDLENTFNKEECYFSENKDNILEKFVHASTPQSFIFWAYVHNAETISELPEIPKNDK